MSKDGNPAGNLPFLNPLKTTEHHMLTIRNDDGVLKNLAVLDWTA